jgi:hypothetical protein
MPTSRQSGFYAAPSQTISRPSFHIYDLRVIPSGSEQMAETDESCSRCLGAPALGP